MSDGIAVHVAVHDRVSVSAGGGIVVVRGAMRGSLLRFHRFRDVAALARGAECGGNNHRHDYHEPSIESV
jgi:hypothetical protein